MDSEALGTVGGRVRAVRTHRLWTQDQLAEKAGVGSVTISRIEAGHSRPNTSTIRKLAGALGVDALWLAHGAEAQRFAAIMVEPPPTNEATDEGKSRALAA